LELLLRRCLRIAVRPTRRDPHWLSPLGQRIANMATELTGRVRPTPPISLGRPRWTNLALVVSLAIFWAGVILKMVG